MSYSLSASELLGALNAQRTTFAAIRQDLHAYPETAYEEHRTSQRVAAELAHYGLEVHRGLAGTGVVGVLRRGNSPRAIGLRADMDALPIHEESDLPYRSATTGKMHACGHDGHTATLLLAAKYLSDTRNFHGTVVFIFQPAEEGGGGGREMVRAGLFDRFPVDHVFGMHNMPGLPVGQFAVMPGPMMAAGDYFEVRINGKGGHAALPHTTGDPIVAGSALVQALQTLVSRSVDPLDPAVVSVTQFHAGEANNAIPATAVLRGTVRTYTKSAQETIEAGIKRLATGTAANYGLDVQPFYSRGYPATINTAQEAEFARATLADLAGDGNVLTHLKPLMASEDFSYLLQARPGAYVWIGNGPSSLLHTPRYNFNDDILALGAAAWVRLTEASLAIQPNTVQQEFDHEFASRPAHS